VNIGEAIIEIHRQPGCNLYTRTDSDALIVFLRTAIRSNVWRNRNTWVKCGSDLVGKRWGSKNSIVAGRIGLRKFYCDWVDFLKYLSQKREEGEQREGFLFFIILLLFICVIFFNRCDLGCWTPRSSGSGRSFFLE